MFELSCEEQINIYCARQHEVEELFSSGPKLFAKVSGVDLGRSMLMDSVCSWDLENAGR